MSRARPRSESADSVESTNSLFDRPAWPETSLDPSAILSDEDQKEQKEFISGNLALYDSDLQIYETKLKDPDSVNDIDTFLMIKEKVERLKLTIEKELTTGVRLVSRIHELQFVHKVLDHAYSKAFTRAELNKSLDAQSEIKDNPITQRSKLRLALMSYIQIRSGESGLKPGKKAKIDAATKVLTKLNETAEKSTLVLEKAEYGALFKENDLLGKIMSTYAMVAPTVKADQKAMLESLSSSGAVKKTLDKLKTSDVKASPGNAFSDLEDKCDPHSMPSEGDRFNSREGAKFDADKMLDSEQESADSRSFSRRSPRSI